MNDKEFLEFVEKLVKDEIEILTNKGYEYSGKQNRFNNFEKLARDLGVHPLVIAAIYMKKHIDSIMTFVKDGEVTSNEDIMGRIMDARNYLSLIAGMVKKYRELPADDAWSIPV